MVEISLCKLAADLLQESLVFRGFHPFGQGVDAQFSGDFHHRLHDPPVRAVVFIQIPQQVQIELDKVDIIPAEGIQRGVAAAEVVKPDAEAVSPETSDLFMQSLFRFCHILLGDLHDQTFLPCDVGNLIPPIDLLQCARNVRIVKILG